MNKKIELLDCTLRDGAYITNSLFGTPAINGIIKNMQEARVDIIECGWLKDKAHKVGSVFFHVPADLEQHLLKKSRQKKLSARSARAPRACGKRSEPHSKGSGIAAPF